MRKYIFAIFSVISAIGFGWLTAQAITQIFPYQISVQNSTSTQVLMNVNGTTTWANNVATTTINGVSGNITFTTTTDGNSILRITTSTNTLNFSTLLNNTISLGTVNTNTLNATSANIITLNVSSLASDPFVVGGTATTTIRGNGATSTFGGNVQASGTLSATGLTNGSVLFATSSGAISQNNGSLYWDNTSTSLGIGNSSPLSKLHITDTSNATSSIRSDLTWNTAGKTFTGLLFNITDINSAAGSFLLDFRTAAGGTSQFNVSKTGVVQIANAATQISGTQWRFQTGSTGQFIFNGTGQFKMPTNGNLQLLSDSSADFNKIQFGGSAAPYVAIKSVSSTNSFNFRDAGDTKDASITAASGTFSGAIIAVTSSTIPFLNFTNATGTQIVLTSSSTIPLLNFTTATGTQLTLTGLGTNLVKSTNGILGNATSGIDYQGVITFPIPVASTSLSAGSNISINTNTISAPLTFNGTPGRVTITSSSPTWTFSGPQDFYTTSTPTFASATLSNFTNNSVIYADGGGALAQNNNMFVWRNASTTLQIGTSTPVGQGTSFITSAQYAPLYIVDDGNRSAFAGIETINTGTAAVAALRTKSDTATQNFQSHASTRTISRFGVTLGGWNEFLSVNGNGLAIGTNLTTPLVLGVSSTAVLYLSSSSVGMVGLGTTTPSQALTIVDTSNATQLGIVGGTGGTPGTGIQFSNPGQTGGKSFIFGANHTTFAGAGYFYIRDNTSGTTRMVIDPNGNVGIGTTTPPNRFTISENTSFPMLIDGGGSSVFQFSKSGVKKNSAGYFDTGTNPEFGIGNGAADTVHFFVNTSGNVGIGTTTPAYKFVVTGTAQLPNLTTSAATQTDYLCLNSVGEVISDTGTCLASSKRFKNNINPFSGGLAETLKLQPVTFYYNDTRKNNPNYTIQQFGFVAEDVFAIDPRLVTLDKDKKPLSFRYENFTAVLTSAIQELNTKVDKQEKEIQQLKEQVKQLMKKK